MRIVLLVGVLSSIVLLLVLSSPGSRAGISEPSDLDGIPDHLDNCVFIPNGPLLGVCNAQQDGDMDGYGVSCDTDYNNNGATDSGDVLTALIASSGIPSTVVVTDLNCNGAADSSDLFTTLVDASGVPAVPGPSGLACAGTPPCP